MTLVDALTITALGMGVVFSGLLLTALLIVAFGWTARLLDRAPHPTPTAAGLEPRSNDVEEVPPEILAVITAVLEVERRLNRLAGGGSREAERD